MKAIYKALSDFQQEVPNIYKNASGYGYKFADLGEINDIIKPIMKKHGLGYIQPLDGENIKTIVFHIESGESIESVTHIPQGVQLAKMNEFQVLGSAITYLRRYSLSSLLGLITDEDADAAGVQVMTAKEKADSRQQVYEDGAAARLDKAKRIINETLESQDYTNPVSKKAFITKVLGHSTIDNIEEADLVMDALENEE